MSSSPATGQGQARPGNTNATGRRDASPSAGPSWHTTARKRLAQEYALGRFRNWGGDGKAPNLYGMTVTAPDPCKANVPDPGKPYLASYGGVQTWHANPATARAEIEAEFVRQENAKREARMKEHPLSDPRLVAALHRALRNR
ncbi:hypothetical protein [Arthrobacter sp. EPSL27]|uniref:hypothetical protein n=1 Tax=Arthrobacter sp. EPSL27 TaxID=1745378 RepID=UPI00074718A9|nr:hypothetical protein [Arthrobacter sp. EPSL27]KUM37701.1 hypothetical protein AR539_10825 [Arthrobacter sp. EPSL27]